MPRMKPDKQGVAAEGKQARKRSPPKPSSQPAIIPEKMLKNSPQRQYAQMLCILCVRWPTTIVSCIQHVSLFLNGLC